MGEVKMMMMMKEEEGDMMILRVEEEEVEAAAPFLRKTYQIVDEPLTDHIVSWGQNHNTFVVWRPPEFARDLLPNHFKHNNFSSFVRQLNTYGFKKIVADRWEFSNEYFRKGQKHLLSEIQRRKTPLHHHHHEPPPPPLLGPPQNLFNCKTNSFFPHLPSTKLINSNDVLKSLREDNHRLRKKNFMLLSELTHMKKLYTEIIFFMQTHVKLPFALENHQQRPSDHPHPHPHHEAPLLLKSLDSCNNSSVTINDHEDDHEPCESNVKLFGVSLSRKKRKKIEGEELESRLSFD